MCSRKCATPLFSAVSYLEPVSIHSPTVEVGEPVSSVATRIPLSSTLTSVDGGEGRSEEDEAAAVEARRERGGARAGAGAGPVLAAALADWRQAPDRSPRRRNLDMREGNRRKQDFWPQTRDSEKMCVSSSSLLPSTWTMSASLSL